MTPPQIQVSAPTRLTPMGKPFVIRARWSALPRWQDHYWILLCRGARIRARELYFSADVHTTPRGWLRAKGSLWLTAEGEYEVRSEANNPELFAKEMAKAPSVLPKSHPFFFGPPMGYARHVWTPGPPEQETDDMDDS